MLQLFPIVVVYRTGKLQYYWQVLRQQMLLNCIILILVTIWIFVNVYYNFRGLWLKEAYRPTQSVFISFFSGIGKHILYLLNIILVTITNILYLF